MSLELFAHPVLEAPGAAGLASSKYGIDECLLLPVPVSTWQNRLPFYFSIDSIISDPCSDSSFRKSGCFIDVQIPGNFPKPSWGTS